MAKNAKETTAAVPPPAMPPLPPTAHHAEAAPAIEVAQVPFVDVGGVQMEAHPNGTAQYIAELEQENEAYIKVLEAVRGRATEGFKSVAGAAITHAAQMAGHIAQDINAIPGIDAINAAGGAPQ